MTVGILALYIKVKFLPGILFPIVLNYAITTCLATCPYIHCTWDPWMGKGLIGPKITLHHGPPWTGPTVAPHSTASDFSVNQAPHQTIGQLICFLSALFRFRWGRSDTYWVTENSLLSEAWFSSILSLSGFLCSVSRCLPVFCVHIPLTQPDFPKFHHRRWAPTESFSCQQE